MNNKCGKMWVISNYRTKGGESDRVSIVFIRSFIHFLNAEATLQIEQMDHRLALCCSAVG